MTMLTMKCVPVPDWARPFALLRSEEFGEQEFSRCSTHHGALLESVQEAVQQFINDDESVFNEEEQIFPQRKKLTGEYHIAEEYYYGYRAQYPPRKLFQRKYAVNVRVRCLEKQWLENQTDFDYLGLELFFLWEPKQQTFLYSGDIEPSSI